MNKSHRNRNRASPHKKSVSFATSPVVLRHITAQNDDDLAEDDHDYESEDSESDSLFIWDEESTLLDALLDKPKTKPGDDPSVLALTESLSNAFVERGEASKMEMARVFVSLYTEVKNGFETLDNELEPRLGKEIVKFNIAHKNVEQRCLRIAEIVDKFDTHKAACKRLEEQIESNFTARDALYDRFEEFAEKTLTPVMERLYGLPARNERWMIKMFEDLKAVEKKYSKIADSIDLNNSSDLFGILSR